MQWKLNPIAGIAGNSGYADGPAKTAQFLGITGIALSTDESKLYVLEAYNNALRCVDLTQNTVTTTAHLTDVARWDAAGTISTQPYNMSIGPDGDTAIIVGYNMDDPSSGALMWVDSLSTGTVRASAPPVMGYGITHDPGGATATVIGSAGIYSSYTLALTGPDVGSLTLPPTLPDPPFCDPPANTIPVTVVRPDLSTWRFGGVGLVRLNELAVAFNPGNFSGSMGVRAWDQWSTTGFPGPYTTCTDPTQPADVRVESGSLYPPWNACVGPDDPDTGYPTMVGALWGANDGILARAVLDVAAQTITVDKNLTWGLTNQPTMSVAYAPTRGTYYLASSSYLGRVSGLGYSDQIFELVLAPDPPPPPQCSGGSGRMPIVTIPPPSLGNLTTEDGSPLTTESGDHLVWT
jgi:hypothetical protein